MPALAEETSLFPDNLFALKPAEQDRTWWAVHTKARQEKALARELLALEVPFYLPLVKKYSLLRGRRVCAHLPLFQSYVFLCLQGEERQKLFDHRRVAARMAHMLPVRDADLLQRELAQLNRLIASKSPITLEERLEPGQRVRIKTGPMKGMEGTLLVRRSETRLLVAIDFIQQGASIEVHDFQLEPL